MKLSQVTLLSLCATMASAIELTPDNWDAKTADKTILVKFFAPWCEHSQRIQPDWDKLMKKTNNSSTKLVADVDCTADGKEICQANGVRESPAIKYGDPFDLQTYEGERDYDSLKKFVKENLKPLCSPTNIKFCDDDKKKQIKTFMSMTMEDLDAKIAAGDKKNADAEELFDTGVQELEATLEKVTKDKEETIDGVIADGLGLIKACKVINMIPTVQISED